jgi:hypothetical protein
MPPGVEPAARCRPGGSGPQVTRTVAYERWSGYEERFDRGLDALLDGLATRYFM